jgi:hypothetical protein
MIDHSFRNGRGGRASPVVDWNCVRCRASMTTASCLCSTDRAIPDTAYHPAARRQTAPGGGCSAVGVDFEQGEIGCAQTHPWTEMQQLCGYQSQGPIWILNAESFTVPVRYVRAVPRPSITMPLVLSISATRGGGPFGRECTSTGTMCSGSSARIGGAFS